MRQIAVVGLGKFGSTVAKELTAKGIQVIALDKNENLVEELKDIAMYAVSVNTTDENALKQIGIQDVDVAIVCIGENIEANLLTTLLLKKLGVRKIWARAISPLQQEILRILEVDSVINLEEEMGKIIAGNLVSISLTRRIPLTPNHSLAEIKIPENFIGKTIRQIDPRNNFKITIVAIKKKVPQIDEHGERAFEEVLEDVSSLDTPLEEEDILLIIGENENIEKLSME